MLVLPNGCHATEPSGYPSDWQDPGADASIDWYVWYRFYDPLFTEKLGAKGKLVVVKKGINNTKTLQGKRAAVKAAIKKITQDLNSGYNPVTGITNKKESEYNITPPATLLPSDDNVTEIIEVTINAELHATAQVLAKDTEKMLNSVLKEEAGKIKIHKIKPDALFINALWSAYPRIRGVKRHKTDVRSTIRNLNMAAFFLGLLQVPIKEITLQNLINCLDVIASFNKRFSNLRKNKYRSYIISLFKILTLSGAIPQNFTDDLPTFKKSKPIPKTPTNEELARIDPYLKTRDYYFWRFVRIFYHSGSRETEMSRLQYKDVNLSRKEFNIWVLKGVDEVEYTKPIPTIVIPLWQQLMEDCEKAAERLHLTHNLEYFFLFSRLMEPNIYQIAADNYTKRWTKYVKKELGIDVDMYKLKHLYSDRLSEQLSLKHAMTQNSHTNAVTTEIYAFGESHRRTEQLKSVNVPFISYSDSTPSNLTPIEKAGYMVALDENSVNVFEKLKEISKLSNSEFIFQIQGYQLKLNQSENAISTSTGQGCLYLLMLGIEGKENWISVCEVSILMTPSKLNKPGETTILTYYVSTLSIPFLGKNDIAIQIDKGVIKEVNYTKMYEAFEFTQILLRHLSSHFL